MSANCTQSEIEWQPLALVVLCRLGLCVPERLPWYCPCHGLICSEIISIMSGTISTTRNWCLRSVIVTCTMLMIMSYLYQNLATTFQFRQKCIVMPTKFILWYRLSAFLCLLLMVFYFIYGNTRHMQCLIAFEADWLCVLAGATSVNEKLSLWKQK